jgi:hypothetical protein
MKKLLSAMVALALISGAAWASVPDPDYCVVNPGDSMAFPRILGIPAAAGGAPYWNLDITVRAYGGINLANVFVEVVFDGSCGDPLCTCTGLSLTGYTNASGFLRLLVRLGGCCEATAAAIILADAVPIRSYEFVVSPDLTSPLGGGDCQVVLADFSAFGTGIGSGASGCTDFTGDNTTNLGDFVVFGGGWGKSCPH